MPAARHASVHPAAVVSRRDSAVLVRRWRPGLHGTEAPVAVHRPKAQKTGDRGPVRAARRRTLAAGNRALPGEPHRESPAVRPSSRDRRVGSGSAVPSRARVPHTTDMYGEPREFSSRSRRADRSSRSALVRVEQNDRRCIQGSRQLPASPVDAVRLQSQTNPRTKPMGGTESRPWVPGAMDSQCDPARRLQTNATRAIPQWTH